MQHRMFSGVIPRTLLVFIVGLIVVSTGLFVIGVVIEHNGSGTSAAVSTTQKISSTSGDPDGGHESSGSPLQTSPTTHESGGLQNETVFGLDLESPWFVAVFVLGWLVLIAVLIRFGRITLPVILLLAVVVTVLDVGEVIRQIGEAKSVIATLAVLVALMHIALAALALLVLTRNARQSPVQQV